MKPPVSKQANLQHIIESYYESYRIPAACFDLTEEPHSVQCLFQYGSFCDDLTEQLKQSRRSRILTIGKHNYALLYLHPSKILAIGPVKALLLAEVDDALPSEDENEGLPFKYWIQSLDFLCSLLGIDKESLHFDPSRIEDLENHSRKGKEFGQAAQSSKQERYRGLEEILLRFVKDGNPTGIQHLITSNLDQLDLNPDLDKGYPGDARNYCVSWAILCSRAAIDGGLPAKTSYSIANDFISQAQSILDLSSIKKLQSRIPVAFAICVGHLKMPAGCSPLTLKTMEIIASNLFEKITPQTIAENLGVHPSHLQKVFSRDLKTSIQAYIQTLRLQQGALLLRQTDLPIQDIAASLQFSSQSHFGRAFKAKYEMTPAKWRQQDGDKTDY